MKLTLCLVVLFSLCPIRTAQTSARDHSLRVGEKAKPNIILVMADDQGWGDVGYNGHPFVKTPALDAMAENGFVLNRFYAAAPVCSPTRASVMTGRHPIRTKVPNHGRYMRPHEQTIAESLKSAGYVTGIFGKVHLGSGQPGSTCNPSGMGFDEWVIGLNFYDNDPYLSRNGKIEKRKGKGSVLAMDDALAFLKKHKQNEKPIFTVVWFPSPHDPHQEVPDGPSLYDGKKHAGYYREITLLDQQVGRLRRELRSLGMAENTLVWYCSDNGGLVEATSGGRKRKGSIYEGGLRVPGIIEWPSRNLKGQSSVPASTCDIYPTLLAMAGVDNKNPHPLDGIDISEIISGKVKKRSKPMGFWHQFQPGQATWSDRIQKAILEKQRANAPLPHNPIRIEKDVNKFPQFDEETSKGHAAWTDWPWKLHRINGAKYELYNLAKDPQEAKNLVGDTSQKDRVSRMKKELKDWMRSVVRSINGDDYEGISKPVVIPTPSSLELGSLTSPFQLKKTTRILVQGGGDSRGLLISHAQVLAAELEILTGLRIPVVKGLAKPGPDDIVLAVYQSAKVNGKAADKKISKDESYKLVSHENGLQVTGISIQGMMHGTSTLLQLVEQVELRIPALTIEDSPAAPYRALMLDVARSPHSIGVIEDAIRLCRLYKIRYLHLHLTDDQNFTFPFPPVTSKLKRNFCYSIGELKSLVSYADSRGVTIIPELDLPGHSTRLKQSGYLSRSKTDADVASPENYEKIGKIVDSMIDVFSSSPYFHIGGDESGAGRSLVPFISAINKRVREKGKRLLVWEGFHGAPLKEIPATGDDRVIVLAWESAYNPPWNLLKNGYEVINASWKPTYLTGGYGGLIHPGSTGGKRFSTEDIYRWDKNTFMHWEPGRPVFEDRGPNDPNRNDGEWNASYIGKAGQINGGQMLYWEQQENSVIHFLHPRLPFLAERLWNPTAGHSFSTFEKRVDKVRESVHPLVQPIQILPVAEDSSHPVVNLYQPYTGETVKVTLRNRTKIKGKIRYSTGGWSGSLNSPNFRQVPRPDKVYKDPIVGKGPFSVRAELVRADGTPVDGHSWQFYNNWPDRVEVTEYDIGRRTLKRVPDLEALPKSKILRRYQMPYIRGLMTNVEVRGQKTITDLVAPNDGKHTLELRTQSGHATLYFDLNQNGQFEENEILVKDSPNDESGQKSVVTLKRGERYRMRIDHSTGIPRPVLLLFITGPDGKRTEISKHVYLPK